MPIVARGDTLAERIIGNTSAKMNTKIPRMLAMIVIPPPLTIQRAPRSTHRRRRDVFDGPTRRRGGGASVGSGGAATESITKRSSVLRIGGSERGSGVPSRRTPRSLRCRSSAAHGDGSSARLALARGLHGARARIALQQPHLLRVDLRGDRNVSVLHDDLLAVARQHVRHELAHE